MTLNFHEIMSFTAGALQFVVAGYALRLNRLFGTTRVGWSRPQVLRTAAEN